MDITPLVPEGQKIIQRYGAGNFVINGENFSYPIIVLADEVVKWSGEADIDFKNALDMLLARKEKIEVVLFGLGEQVQSLLPQHLKNELKAAGIATDIMNTGAACRTYNVLLAEGRNVAAAVFPVE